MTATNFSAFLAFAWRPGFDNPADGYHNTKGDPGGGTLGGVTEATWAAAEARGLVTGQLRNATRQQLSTILQDEYWGDACDALPTGIDFMLANGRMMSGGYPKIFQSCLGLIGADVDGDIGPETIAAAISVAPATFVSALHGAHYQYLRALFAWPEFGNGWTTRLVAAHSTALGMVRGSNSAV